MNIDGSAPLKGPQADRTAASKPAPKGGGKSFAAAFDKAATAHPLKGSPAGSPAPAQPAPAPESAAALNISAPDTASNHIPAETAPASTHTGAPVPELISAEDHLATVKFRLKSGYYNTKTVDDALTEKLTGFFDELA